MIAKLRASQAKAEGESGVRHPAEVATMKRFKNILVGVGLAQGDVLVPDNLAPPTEETIARALWLGKCNFTIW